MVELPTILKDRIERTWGAQGSSWAFRFSESLRTACDRWNLSELRLFANLSYHFVAACRMGDRDVVLKLGVPEPEIRLEAAALLEFGNGKCAELIDADLGLAALILERVSPGQSLESMWSQESDDLHTRIIAQSMTLNKKVAKNRFPSVLDWAKALEVGGTNIPNAMICRAKHLVQEIHSNRAEWVLLHGDLHHGNTLHSDNGWRVIDPKGVLGDPSFESYALLRNPVGSSPNFTLSRWKRRIDIVAEVTGQARDRLLKGAFCGTVISCCWSAEEGGAALEADIELARRLEAAIC